MVYDFDDNFKMHCKEFMVDEGSGWIVRCDKCGAEDSSYRSDFRTQIDWPNMRLKCIWKEVDNGYRTPKKESIPY